jgi:hypothetical protein
MAAQARTRQATREPGPRTPARRTGAAAAHEAFTCAPALTKHVPRALHGLYRRASAFTNIQTLSTLGGHGVSERTPLGDHGVKQNTETKHWEAMV